MPALRLLQPRRNALRPLYRAIRLHWKLTLSIVLLLCAEALIHAHRFKQPQTQLDLDPPFQTGCRDSPFNTTARANATFVMLARNKEVEGAMASVRSVQMQFNDHFGYPWVFLNDEEWSDEFKRLVGNAVGDNAKAAFEVIPKTMWGYPDWMDQTKAKSQMTRMKDQGVQYAGMESYHHMCRFQSGYVLSLCSNTLCPSSTIKPSNH